MKLQSIVIVCLPALAASASIRGNKALEVHQDAEPLPEDEIYWRMAQETEMSLEPTPAPVECEIDALIDCFVDDEANTPCEQIPTPNIQCSAQTDIEVLRFRVTDGTCDDEFNTQDDVVSPCVDTSPIPAAGAVSVICAETANATNVLTETVVLVGSTFLIGDVTSALPNSITCMIQSTDGLTTYQTTTFVTDGNADLFLEDTFGGLFLEACNVNGSLQTCVEPIIYTYGAQNVGPTNVTLTSLERERDGDFLELIEDVDDPFLMPGETATATERIASFDICVSSTTVFTTNLRAKADTPCRVN